MKLGTFEGLEFKVQGFKFKVSDSCALRFDQRSTLNFEP